MTIATDLEHYMLTLVNQERTSRGLDPLLMEQNLNTSADAHSEWMTRANIFAHEGDNGSSATDRMLAADMDLTAPWKTAENLAATSVTGTDSYIDEIDRMHVGLMESPGHRANILDPDLDYVGIGLAFGPLSYGTGTPQSSLLITQNFATTNGRADLDLPGSRTGDRLIGNSGDDYIDGGAGNDTLDGRAGDDTLIGGHGFDVIDGGAGNDLIQGGSRGDRIYGGDGSDRVNGGFGRDSVWLGNGNDHFTDVGQNGFGGNGADTIVGGGGDDVYFGGNGRDEIHGGSGSDRIVAGNQDDVVTGGFGRDTVFLGRGNDRFTDHDQGGWWGSDRVDGGAGSDTIELRAGNDTVSGGSGDDVFIFTGSTIGQDTITDYQTGRDALHIDDDLWGSPLTEAQVIAEFASTRSGDVVFDFGDGNTITLAGVQTTAGLLDDLVIC
jgi:serralysin